MRSSSLLEILAWLFFAAGIVGLILGFIGQAVGMGFAALASGVFAAALLWGFSDVIDYLRLIATNGKRSADALERRTASRVTASRNRFDFPDHD